MPLIKSKSKKAFEHNMETEMAAGKPKDQSLAIAYNVQRKPKKKKMADGGNVKAPYDPKHVPQLDPDKAKAMSDVFKAEGGMINASARSERRPMPEERDKDAQMVSRNSNKKAPKNDQWLDSPTVAQAQSNNGRKVMPIKRPKMVPSDAFSTRMQDEEAHLQDSAGVNEGPQHQPSEHDNEEGADRQGPSTPSLRMKLMYEGGAVSEEAAEADHAEHPQGLEEDNDQMRPPKDEYMADHFAEGGKVSPQEEMNEEEHNSIAAAIMAKKRHYAEGGSVSYNGEDSIYAHPEEDQADLRRNAEEDANMEDQSSFNAMRKENYSESEGLEKLDSPMDSAQHGDKREDDEENHHDMISSIRSKMNMKRQFR